MSDAGGPLAGLRVVEFASIGPGPHCAMLLADQGADVLRIERPGGNGWPNPIMGRGRATMTLDIRGDDGGRTAREACDLADVVIEGFRPGVMERLGLGPDDLLQRNPRLVYGRMTGWGQDGPMARVAGHDINYIAMAGALAAIGPAGERAVPPLNLVGDFGGGSMFLAFGIMAALWERERSGRGQIVDAAIVDGVSNLMTMFTGLAPSGRITLDRAGNPLGGAAPYYRTYRCADGLEMAVGAIEPQFWAELLRILDIEGEDAPALQRPPGWPRAIDLLERAFASESRPHWIARFAGSDACVYPVITCDDALHDAHLAARATFVDHDGLAQPAPAPRFSRTPGRLRSAQSGEAMLARWKAS